MIKVEASQGSVPAQMPPESDKPDTAGRGIFPRIRENGTILWHKAAEKLTEVGQAIAAVAAKVVKFVKDLFGPPCVAIKKWVSERFSCCSSRQTQAPTEPAPPPSEPQAHQVPPPAANDFVPYPGGLVDPSTLSFQPQPRTPIPRPETSQPEGVPPKQATPPPQSEASAAAAARLPEALVPQPGDPAGGPSPATSTQSAPLPRRGWLGWW